VNDRLEGLYLGEPKNFSWQCSNPVLEKLFANRYSSFTICCLPDFPTSRLPISLALPITMLGLDIRFPLCEHQHLPILICKHLRLQKVDEQR
jgi:hypothetical protein